MRSVIAGLTLTILLAAVGCNETLETGYTPRRLNATESDRRAFYAPQYTPDTHTSNQPSAPDLGMRH
jgi:hypothetical protein